VRTLSRSRSSSPIQQQQQQQQYQHGSAGGGALSRSHSTGYPTVAAEEAERSSWETVCEQEGNDGLSRGLSQTSQRMNVDPPSRAHSCRSAAGRATSPALLQEASCSSSSYRQLHTPAAAATGGDAHGSNRYSSLGAACQQPGPTVSPECHQGGDTAGDRALDAGPDPEVEDEDREEDVTIQVAHNLQQLQQRLAQLDRSFSLGGAGASGKSSPAVDAWLTGVDAAGREGAGGSTHSYAGSKSSRSASPLQFTTPAPPAAAAGPGVVAAGAGAWEASSDASWWQQQQQQQQQQGYSAQAARPYSAASSRSRELLQEVTAPAPLADSAWPLTGAAARLNNASPVLGLSSAPAPAVAGPSSPAAATWAPAAAAAAAAAAASAGARHPASPSRGGAGSDVRNSKGSPIRNQARSALYKGGAGSSPGKQKPWQGGGSGVEEEEDEEEGGWGYSSSSAAAARGVAAAQRPLLAMARREVAELQQRNDALVSVLNRERAAAEQLRGRVRQE
jgi:hypothetical protein